MTQTAPLAVHESTINSLRLLARGKVRDIYEIDDQHLLFVASDRLSAFDVILDDPIPGKGEVLTTVSNYWFERFADFMPNHLSGVALESVLSDPDELAQARGRSIVVKRLKPLPVEAIVRGYLIGSGWSDYKKTGQVCGIDLAEGLQMAQQLPEPIYTPSTKAEVGDHDENISYDETVKLLGEEMAAKVRDRSLEIYKTAAEYALTKGIIIADTKFEFGLDDAGELHLIDEVLTPDSSRFWPADQYELGVSPPSFDKQFIRDWLSDQGWNKQAPAPRLPEDVINQTTAKYQQAQKMLFA